MGDVGKIKELLAEAQELALGGSEEVEKNNGGVTSIQSLRQDLGTNSAETILTSGTDDKKKKKFITDRTVDLSKSIKIGSKVTWNSSGGRVTGKVANIIRQGPVPVPDSSVELKASEDDPVATIEILDDEGKPDGRVVGHKVKSLKLAKGDAKGIIHRVNGKPLKITGLSDKEKDEYLYGDTKIEKMVAHASMIAEYLEALNAPEIEEDFEEVLEKCDKSKSFLIKGKIGKWRRVSGAPVFICSDGTIHAGPRHFVGKNVNSLRDDLRAEKKKRSKQGSKSKG